MSAGASILQICEALSRLSIRIAGFLILGTALLICVETFLRRWLGMSTGGADELSGYALAASASLAFSFTLLKRGHVRVDAFYSRLPVRYKAALDCLGLWCLSIFSMTLAFYAVRVLSESLALSAVSNTTLATPLWIPQFIWIIGLVLFSATSALLTMICSMAMLTGDYDTIQYRAGSSADIIPPVSPGLKKNETQC